MEIDRELVEGKLADIKGTLEELRGITEKGVETFLSENYLRYAAKYLLITAIEGAFSVCNHIAVRKGRIPKSYSECFKQLADLGVIERELGERLSEMAKFRNLLVHQYWRVDDERVFRIMKEDISDLEEFIESVVRYLEKGGD
ncbi:type VII toxin-antitoxin system HepT family RNase toxin [Thermococcus sp.]